MKNLKKMTLAGFLATTLLLIIQLTSTPLSAGTCNCFYDPGHVAGTTWGPPTQTCTCATGGASCASGCAFGCSYETPSCPR